MTIKSFFLGAMMAAASFTTQAAPQLIDQVVAVVDDDIIMASELDARMQLLRQQSAGQAMPDNATLRDQVLERMILESIQLQMADRGGIRITDAQLNDALGRIAAQNNMNLAQFRQTMEAEGVSFAQARDQIANEMRISRVQRFQVGERIQITDQDVDYFLASELGKMASAAEYNLGHILIAVPSDASPGDLQKAAKKADDIVARLRNGDDFRKMAMAESSGRTALNGGELGWRKEAQLPGIFAPVVPALKVGGVSDPIKSPSGYHIVKLLEKRGGNTQMVTQTKTRHILIRTNELRDDAAAEALINDLYQRVQAGGDFTALAKEFSDDPGSGASGGDLGWVNPGDMVPEFDSTMADTAAGGISAPFRSQFGWHILQVEERRETDIGAENQRNQVRNLLYSRRFEEELPIWLRKVRSEAYVDIKERP
ncbi:peptidylprolyl isomerase [Thalassolituus marinus]|uniref:Chaperone SurA n=1 Tax=Thalassolituus marinus TaxID=671053 RepID=A0ABS7ZR89_9GAMM|nr:peptidylprolyl isomerase [Thalassolituus marinus]MCA6064234.1 peptidylprolyl isomerase [Thalassolituus marinus]